MIPKNQGSIPALYSLPLETLKRYLQWLAAWKVEGERLLGEFKSPYRETTG